MPISEYYGGRGAQVMADMRERYGDKKGESVFYATAQKRGQTPSSDSAPKRAKHADLIAGKGTPRK